MLSLLRGILFVVPLLAWTAEAAAQTRTTFEYDPHGRLVRTERDTGDALCYTYDAANNIRVVAGVSSSATCNSAPTAVDDFWFEIVGSSWTGNLDVLANDIDADLPGDPLTITTVSGSPYVTVHSSGDYLRAVSIPAGSYMLSYTMKDQGNLTSSATVELILCQSPCFE